MKNRYKELTPFVGSNYESSKHKKLIIVGESHYLPDYSTIHLDADVWYEGNSSQIDTTESGWLNTSNLIEWATESGFSEKGFSMYRQLNAVLRESGLIAEKQIGGNDYYLNEIAYFNYFQRPANTGNSIKEIFKDIDAKIAFENFQAVMLELRPDLLVIASKFANAKAEDFEVWAFLESIGCKYCYTPHPTSAWWNTHLDWKSFEGRTGKEQMLYLLSENNFLHSHN